MIKKSIVLPSETALTLSFAERVVEAGRAFQSMLKMECGCASVNIRSTLGIISLGRYAEMPAVLIAEGSDEEEALRTVSALFEVPGDPQAEG